MSRSAGSEEFRVVNVRGPDDAPEVVFVHGTIFNRTMWAPQRDALSDEFRVIAPDLPGHGTRDDEEFRLEPAIETVDAVFDELVDGSAHLVGLSLGGYVAQAYARRRSERVDHLVVSGSSANPVGLVGVLTRVAGEGVLLASKSDLVDRAADWALEKYVRSRDVNPGERDEIVDAGFDVEPFGRAGREIAGVDFRSAFASFAGPSHVLNGRYDVVMRLGEQDHARAGDAEVTVIDKAGHACNLDQPDVYTAVVERLVDATATVEASE